jgi:hypothetical protein
MYELPPTLGRSRTDLVVLAALIVLVVVGGLALAFGQASLDTTTPAKAPNEPTTTLLVS